MQFQFESIRRPFSSFSRRNLLIAGGAVAAAVIGAGVFYNAHGSSSGIYSSQSGQNNQRTIIQRQVSGNPLQQVIVHTQQQAQQAQQQAQQGAAACTSGDSPQSRTISLGKHTFNICPPAVPAH